MYHSIPDTNTLQDTEQMTTPLDLFKRQMEYLAEHRFNCLASNEWGPSEAVK